MSVRYETTRWAERRRPFEQLEAEVVRLYLQRPDETPRKLVDRLRYVLSFARLTQVRNRDGGDADVGGILHAHALQVHDAIAPRLRDARSLWDAINAVPDLVHNTRRARRSLLDHVPLDRDSLEEEVTRRVLAVASGGGGGAGYVYFGAYEALERAGLAPDLMVGTSIGALTSMFRCRRRQYDQAPQVAAARRLSWTEVLRVAETESRYGLPATLRLYLRSTLLDLFKTQGGEPMRLCDMEIPLYVIAAGITVDALKHDLFFYEHYFDEEVGRGGRVNLKGILKAAQILREFLARPDALDQVVLGRDEGTEEFDAIDAAGFSAAVPGVLHYDVLRPDTRMRQILDHLYAEHGITRLGEGGLVSNVPARVAWESVVGGQLGRRNVLVLALDCFAPNPKRLAWYPFQQLVRNANVERDRKFADVYVPATRTLSPMNVVPSLREALNAISWGKEACEPHMPQVVELMRRIPVLPDT